MGSFQNAPQYSGHRFSGFFVPKSTRTTSHSETKWYGLCKTGGDNFVNLSCGFPFNPKFGNTSRIPISECLWTRTIQFESGKNFSEKFFCKEEMDELDWNALTCSGIFKDGLCQLLIHDIQFMKHHGNWSCQVKLESNGSYVNATGSPLQLLVLAPDWKDWMMSHMNRIIGGFMYYLDAVKNMMAEMKMNRKLMDKMKMDVENDMDEFMDA